METIKGQQVYKAIGFGKLLFLDHKTHEINDEPIKDINQEIEIYLGVKEKVLLDLDTLYKTVLSKDGEDAAEIFEVHQMMINDEDFDNSIISYIRDKKSCAYAIAETSKHLEKTFLSLDDEYFSARAADVRDISQRLLNKLFNKTITLPNGKQKWIIVSDDLLPSETLNLDIEKIAGFVMFEGSLTSHAAILSKMKQIPTIVQTKPIDTKYENYEAIIDGVDGLLYIEPNEETTNQMIEKHKNTLKKHESLKQFFNKKSLSKDGHEMKIMANISQFEDSKQAIEQGSDGIGLFRTEFLYINQSTYPTEDEQFIQYKKVLEVMNGKPVVIRTMDIGTDKTADYFNLPLENNPALGYRAIRISLDRPEILMTQLRALLRASSYGHLCIMFPMITSVWEIQMLKDYLKKAEHKLISQNIKISPYEVGIMIETPAAAIISDDLAQEVDFFSVGTNDLTQYTLAVDRQNTHVKSYGKPDHKAVLRLIKMASDAIHQYPNKWIGICGELASHEDLTAFFLGIKIDELSMSPSYVLPIRYQLSKIDMSQAHNEVIEKIK